MTSRLSSLDALESARPAQMDGDDAKSVGEALRATLLFLVIIGFLAWAGAADAHTSCAPGGGRVIAAGASTG
jgi:hypothetical protein